MKKLKGFISIICIVALVLCSTISSSAVPVEECSYQSALDNRSYASPVEEAAIDDGCLYYAILSTAGSYAKKYFNASDDEADFSEESLAAVAGNPDIHNFGAVLYDSVGCNIGNRYAITSVELLSDKGTRYLKEKISENGAIVAAIPIPEEDGLSNEKYYNAEESNFVYPEDENDNYHAVSIVGWDDDYDRAKFNQDESGANLCKKNGAWICKNSYGTDFGDEGYFYVSYTTPLIYAAALEVSQTGKFDLTLKANQVIDYLGFVCGVNVRAYSSSTEKITVNVGTITAFDGEVTLKNGCNLIMFDRPVLSGKINIRGNNISTAVDTVYCYVSLLPKISMTFKNADVDENWTEDVEKIWISVENKSASCLSKNPTINHIMRKSSIDNCYYIVPADGYRFTKDTIIAKIDGFDSDALRKLYGKDIYKAFAKNSTIEEAVAADYKRLKNGDGETFKTMIEFDESWDNGRGMLKIVSQNIGSAYVNDVNILTNEKGEIKNTILTFDDGSVLSVPADVSMFRDEAHTESITDIEDINEYFAEVKISGYYSKDLKVKINGVPTECEVTGEGTELSVSVKITIPDITKTIAEFIKTIRLWLAGSLGGLRP